MRHALLQVVWTEMCVGSVCTQPPYNDKNPPSVFLGFLISLSHFPFLISSHSQMPVCVMSHRPRPSHDCWLALAFHHPEWAVISPPLLHRRTRSRQECLLSDWGFLLLDVIMNIAVVIYSRHLSRWRWSGLPLFLKGMRRSPIYLNAFMFPLIIHDPASPTEEVSIRFFYESLQITFPNNVLVSKFRG